MSSPGVAVVAGIGKGLGTGAATAHLFAKAGYKVALIARDEGSLKAVADEITSSGGTAVAFPIKAYDYPNIQSVFSSIKSHFPNLPIRVAIWNVTYDARGSFLSLTPEGIQQSANTNIVAAFAFSREAILAFKENDVNEAGKRGCLIFTSATAAWRGNTTTSAFAMGKFGARALSQSLNKEFGKENIHVSTVIIDGHILTEHLKVRPDYDEWVRNVDIRLEPESIAKSYMYLVNQDRSAWTWELDLRPAHEKW